MKNNLHHNFNSISELHSSLKLKKPSNPLVSVVNLGDLDSENSISPETITYNFYAIFLKKNFDGKIKYGQQYYDFDNGTMTFYSPKQRITIEDYEPSKLEGWMLVFHSDFIQNYPLAKRIKEYGFFSYAANEALHCSNKEEEVISNVMQNLKDEIEKSIDNFTQDVIVSHIDLLLNYCNRFYNRQFITRKPANNDTLIRLENLLNDYFNSDDLISKGLPTVQQVAEQLNVSSNYLSDMLRSITGQTTQQHIHNKLIEKAKELLTTTNLSVSEIAYYLGFEYPQSFNKLFKKKTDISPLEFRQSFN
ncbi:helix-turn-helix transcriptional regulator [Chryseobacterium sp.]|uniref:helix-turn-helix domain-containing protein n=1 Tax=Chryseobacterium sp. TaxID=1871047 RepID=UPI00289A570C|nr:helix-turn-helix transcriptional regulator [Chryseobacterium sp.]